MIYVIGSGPAGVSCAHALLQKGLEVAMIDGGVDLEPDRQKVVDRLGGVPPEEWDEADLRVVRGNMTPTAKGLPTKKSFGSDYPYREAERSLNMDLRGVDAQATLARGGFSSVWGAVVAPYPEEDLVGWPISPAELVPHYRAALELMHLAACDDNLSAVLPLHADVFQSLDPSRQAAAFMEDAVAHRAELGEAGIHIGRSRLAVRAGPSDVDQGCVYCGLCLYGCPYGLIFNSRSTLARLQDHPRFQYRTDVIVDRLEEGDGKVRVVARSRGENRSVEFAGDRIFLAGGVYQSTKIVLESLGAFEEPVTIRDSQYFLLPLLRYRGIPQVESEALHTLAQAFIEIQDPEVSAHTVHMEMFTYNDLLPLAAASRLGVLAPLLRLPIRQLLGRVLVGQCFLHSADSSSIRAKLVLTRRGVGTRFVLTGEINSDTKHVVGRVWRKLLAHRRHLKAVPLPPLIEITRPGRSFHSGGSLPMKRYPSHLETDIWGRPRGFDKIHVVDATVLPTLPATTITLPVMANAHRIASGFDGS